MHYVSEESIERLIREDAPFFDLTTHLLGIEDAPGEMCFVPRGDTVAAGVEEARRVLARLGAAVTQARRDGEAVRAGEPLLTAHGSAGALHMAWRLTAGLLETACGIAGRTARLRAAIRAVSPQVELLTTRKSFPGGRELCAAAALAGGALPHRLGLSETVLIFDNHAAFLGGMHAVADRLPALKRAACDKRVVVEAKTEEEALLLAQAGADGLQIDKMPPERLAALVRQLRAAVPSLLIIGAGGVNLENAAAYAATGVDALSTSWVYFGAPADIRVDFKAVGA